MAENGILIDITKCTGCRACQVTCKEWNRLGADPAALGSGGYESPPRLSAETWTQLRFIERAPETGEGEDGEPRAMEWEFFVARCVHCSHAPCQDSCPTNAIGHARDAYVFILEERCIGCGACVHACPYHAVHLDRARGIARKCTFCFDRVMAGLAPACAKACPSGAIQYGDRDVLLEEGRVRVDALRLADYPEANLYGASQLGGLYQLYVLPRAPSAYGLAPAPVRPLDRSIASWLGGVAAAAALVVGPFWWVYRRRTQLDAESKGS